MEEIERSRGGPGHHAILPFPFVERVAEFDGALIVEALDVAAGVQTRAARSLGMSERHTCATSCGSTS
jgi:transcriptional regulator with GAF, ATPase, and Fis domain